MRKRIIISVLIALTSLSMFAQVRDVTLTLSPYAEHTWWNKNTTLDNSTFWGARAGFSFGPLFEIRGFYQKSLDIEANLRKLDWQVTDDWADKMTESFVDISRYGGEMKLNLMNNGIFAPYITLGGGVQKLSYQLESPTFPNQVTDMKEEQIFGALGLGTKFNLSDRVVLSLEAKNTFFNVNENSYYLSPDYDVEKEGSKRLGNWSAMASLDFYLGGTKSNANEVHKAYEKMFSDGFSGMKFVVEPSMAYIRLKDENLFEEQYFLGGLAGFDFSSLVGIRGFYYQATEDPNKISLDFNNELSMYGANIIARLNQPRGINPYLVLGGGYIKTKDNYINPLGEVGEQSRGFAMGGVGVEIPVTKYVAFYGNINTMLTNKGSKDISTVESPKQVKTNMMYQAGVRFNLGKSVDGDDYYDRYLDRAISSERDYSNQQINELRKEYERKIDDLNYELDNAVKEKNYAKAAKIEEEKRAVELESRQRNSSRKNDYLQLTPDELSRIVKDAVRETRQEYTYAQPQTVAPATAASAAPTAPVQQQPATQIEVVEVQNDNANKELERQIKELNKALESQSSLIAELRKDTVRQNREVVAAEPQVTQEVVTVAPSRGVVKPSSSFTKLKGISALAAMDFGSKFYWNLGARGHWQIKDSKFDLMPEVYLALGKKNGLGASANVVYNFGKESSSLKPYAGIGLGVFPGSSTVWGTNVIAGVKYDLMLGSVFADYSVRSSFKQNQIAVGYKFSF